MIKVVNDLSAICVCKKLYFYLFYVYIAYASVLIEKMHYIR